MVLKTLLFLVGLALSVCMAALSLTMLALPPSPWGLLYLVAGWLIALGLFFLPWTRKTNTIMISGAALFALVLMIALRVVIGMWGSRQSIHMLTLPGGGAPRLGAYLLDEQDEVIYGEALFNLVGGAFPAEHAGIGAALQDAYSAMRRSQAVIPSPVTDTYLALQSAGASDAVLITPGNLTNPQTAVVFLHGSMGNVTVQCWEIARAVERIGALTICPSTGWQGQWWQPQGAATLRQTLDYLRSRGVTDIFLGGFSNGGMGLSRLLSGLADEKGLRGLFFIDGITNEPGLQSIDLPILVIQGARDERIPASMARDIAAGLGPRAQYRELDGDHFLIIKNPLAVQDALAAWLQAAR